MTTTHAAPDRAKSPPQKAEAARPLFGVLAEFDNIDDLLAAAETVRKNGYTRWDVHSPFPVHGMDEATGARPTRLPWIVLVCGLSGMLGGLFLVWWTNVTSFPLPYALRGYPFIISGKPVFSLPANIPVIFETTVLLSAFGAVFGMLLLNRLPRLYNPLFKSERFRRVTADRFFIVIEAVDPLFDADRTARLLSGAKARAVEEVEA